MAKIEIALQLESDSANSDPGKVEICAVDTQTVELLIGEPTRRIRINRHDLKKALVMLYE